jgi:hypothetical protein
MLLLQMGIEHRFIGHPVHVVVTIMSELGRLTIYETVFLHLRECQISPIALLTLHR